MRQLTDCVFIEAPVERVWNVLEQVERWHEWTSSITRIERLDPVLGQAGSRVRILQPRLRPAIWTVDAWVPPRRLSWSTRQPGVRLAAGHELAPHDGGCMFTQTLACSGPLGGLAWLLFGRLTRSYLAMESQGLKDRAEGRR